MSLGESIRGSVRWTLAGRISSQALQFAFGVILARLLLPKDFGLLATVQIFTGLAGFVSGGGMGQALIQARNATQHDAHVVFTAQFVIGLMIFLLLYATAPWLSTWFNNPIYKELFRVSALSFLIRPFVNVPTCLLYHHMRFKVVALINGGILIITGLSSVIMALLGIGVWSLVLGGLIGAISNIFVVSVITNWFPRFVLDRPVLRRLGGYGIKVSANDIIVYVRGQTGNLILSRLIGPTTVGLFNKALSINSIPTQLLSGSAYDVIFRALSKTQDDKKQSKYIYLRTLTLIAVYTMPAYITLWWLAEPIIRVFYGQRWIDAAPALEILIVAGLFICVQQQAGAVAAARNLLNKELIIQIVGWILIILTSLIGYHWGIIGVAWAAVLTSIVVTLSLSHLANKALDVQISELWQAFFPALLLNGSLFTTFFIINTLLLSNTFCYTHPLLYLLGMGIPGMIVYAGCFLYIPLPQLASESKRWKQYLGLPTKSALP